MATSASSSSSTQPALTALNVTRRGSIDAAVTVDFDDRRSPLLVTGGKQAKADGSGAALASPAKPASPAAPTHYTLSPKRWLLLFLFGISSLLSAFIWIQLAPIYLVAQTTFAATAEQVNFVSLVFLIGYLPASVLSMVLMEHFGLKTNLLVGFALDFLCAGVKWGSMLMISSDSTAEQRQKAYAVMLFGQCLGSAGQPLLLNLSSRVSADFFGDHERDFATIALTMINVLGQMLGSLLPPYLIDNESDLRAMFLGTFIPTAIILVVSIFTLSDRPPSPPSASAAAQWAQRDAIVAQRKAAPPGSHSWFDPLKAVWRDTRMLLRDRNFALLLGGFSMGTGAAWALLTVQGQIIQPCGYNDTVAGNSATSLLAVGIVASFAVGPLMRRFKRYALFQKLVTIGSFLAVLFALAVNKPNSEALIYVAWCCCGLMLQPLLPISLEHAAELTYPLSADSSAALLLTSANLFGMALILGLGKLLALPVSANCTSVVTPAAGLILAFMLVGVVVTLPIRPVLKRQIAEPTTSGSSEILATTSTSSAGSTESIVVNAAAVRGERVAVMQQASPGAESVRTG
jgi:MFS transporter, FLVCR family, MFS-domain-containing protein 7